MCSPPYLPSMFEATFRIDGAGAVADLTAGPDAAVDLWCNDHCDLLSVTGADRSAVRDRVAALAGVQEHLADDRALVVITGGCLEAHEEPLVDPYLARHDCLSLPPLSYRDGAKFLRVLTLDPANLTGLYRDLAAEGTVTVESKREVGSVARDGPLLADAAALSALTDRQAETLLAAHERGYYRIPRGTTMAEVAETMGIDRRTAEEHLRRAENKLLDGVVPLLRRRS